MYIFHCNIGGSPVPIKCDGFVDSPIFGGMVELFGVVGVTDTSYPSELVEKICVKKSCVEYYLTLGEKDEEVPLASVANVNQTPEEVPQPPVKEPSPRKKRGKSRR